MADSENDVNGPIAAILVGQAFIITYLVATVLFLNLCRKGKFGSEYRALSLTGPNSSAFRNIKALFSVQPNNGVEAAVVWLARATCVGSALAILFAAASFSLS